MSADTLKWYQKQDKIEVVRRGCRGTQALYAVESLPTKYRVEVQRRFPDMQSETESRAFCDMVVMSGEAAAFYAEYKIDGVRGLDSAKQALYVNDAAIMEAFRRVLERSDSARKKASKPQMNRGEFWKKAAQALPRIADTYQHNLPTNARRLQQKYNEFFRDGGRHYEVFVSGKYKNANASAIQNDEQKALMIRLIGDHRNLNNEQIAMLYNTVAEKLDGWKKVTAKVVGAWRERYDFETAAGRHGKHEFYDQRVMQVSRTKPSTPMLFWTLDGWTVELFYKEYNEHRKATTYTNRLVLEVVLDAYNNYPIGYAIGKRETGELIKEALRNAMNHTAQLFGQRYKADQIQSDQYAREMMTPIYMACGDKYVPARVGNAKAKPIERYFKSLNQKYGQMFENWSGWGIVANKDLQPNYDYLNERHDLIPDEAGVRKQIETIIAAERQSKIADYMAGWQQVKDEYRRPMSAEQYLLTFGQATGHKNALEGSGLNVRILGERRRYESFEVAFRQYAHVRWNVLYDPDNLQEVLATNDDGSVRFMLQEKYLQPMALADRKEGDAEQLARVAAHNKVLYNTASETLCEAQQQVEQLFVRNPQLGNVLAHALITDSRGQHKNALHDRRLQLEQGDYDITPVVQATKQAAAPKKQSIFDLL